MAWFDRLKPCHANKNAQQVKWCRPVIIIHWLTALAVACLFPLGIWMTGLDYYDPWFQKGPYIHETIGILIFLLTILRLLFRYRGKKPVTANPRWAFSIATYVHVTLYLLLVGVLLSGYLTSTADGSAIVIFNWIEIPATIYGLEKQDIIAGQVHFILSICFISLVVLHALAALKHHYYDKDRTLKQMLNI